MDRDSCSLASLQPTLVAFRRCALCRSLVSFLVSCHRFYAMNGHAEPPIEVAIAGGGIGGLCAGLALAGRKGHEIKSNVHVTIYEAAERFQEIGAGVSFGLNAANVMHKLGVFEEYSRIADKVEGVDADTKNVWFEWRRAETEQNERICVVRPTGGMTDATDDNDPATARRQWERPDFSPSCRIPRDARPAAA